MSEEVEKVTTDKPKDAGRQEWGRKLGKMQKELKAKKQMDVPGSSYLKWVYGVAVAGIIIRGFILPEKSYEVAKADVVVKPVKIKTEKKRGTFSDIYMSGPTKDIANTIYHSAVTTVLVVGYSMISKRMVKLDVGDPARLDLTDALN